MYHLWLLITEKLKSAFGMAKKSIPRFLVHSFSLGRVFIPGKSTHVSCCDSQLLQKNEVFVAPTRLRSVFAPPWLTASLDPSLCFYMSLILVRTCWASHPSENPSHNSIIEELRVGLVSQRGACSIAISLLHIYVYLNLVAKMHTAWMLQENTDGT